MANTLTLTRTFDAPAKLVYKAFTDPQLIPQWWGPAVLKTVVEKLDAQPGDQWRFVQTEASGTEYAFRGVFHTTEPGTLLVQTFEFEPMPGHVLLQTTAFEEIAVKQN